MRSRPVVEVILLCVICVVAPLWINCASGYSGDRADFGVDASAEVRRVGCLDVAVQRYTGDGPDAVRSRRAFRVHFGNRCRDPLELHLERIVAMGDGPEGSRVDLKIYDPRKEIRGSTLWAHSQGSEVLLFTPSSAETSATPTRICIDLTAVVEPAVEVSVEPICFGEAPLVIVNSGRTSWL